MTSVQCIPPAHHYYNKKHGQQFLFTKKDETEGKFNSLSSGMPYMSKDPTCLDHNILNK